MGRTHEWQEDCYRRCTNDHDERKNTPKRKVSVEERIKMTQNFKIVQNFGARNRWTLGGTYPSENTLAGRTRSGMTTSTVAITLQLTYCTLLAKDSKRTLFELIDFVRVRGAARKRTQAFTILGDLLHLRLQRFNRVPSSKRLRSVNTINVKRRLLVTIRMLQVLVSF